MADSRPAKICFAYAVPINNCAIIEASNWHSAGKKIFPGRLSSFKTFNKTKNKMIIFNKKLSLETKKQFEIVDITQHAQTSVIESKIKNGIALVFCPHTTAAIRINHNEPLLMQDMMKAIYRLIPIDISYSHDLFEVRQNVAPNERSNGHAHVKAFLMGSSETIPVDNGALSLGGKQSLFFVELDGGRSREVQIKIMGE